MDPLNLIIIENNDSLFELLKQDLRTFTDKIDKIYRCSVHDDVFQLPNWRKCNFIIASNNPPDNRGIAFFKSFYLNDEAKSNKIYGVIYTRGHPDEIQFYRTCRFLCDWTKNLFLGVIYRQPGGLEKLLELIQNIAVGQQIYPILDWLQWREPPTITEAVKLGQLRRLHNLKDSLLRQLEPIVITLSEFTEEKNRTKLKFNLKNFDHFFQNPREHYTEIQQKVREFLGFEFRFEKPFNSKSEISYYQEQIEKFIFEDTEGSLGWCLQRLADEGCNPDRLVQQIVTADNAGTLANFLRKYYVFLQSVNKLVDMQVNAPAKLMSSYASESSHENS